MQVPTARGLLLLNPAVLTIIYTNNGQKVTIFLLFCTVPTRPMFMKYTFSVFLTIASLFFTPATAGTAGETRSLVVLIGHYPPGSGWGRLHCSDDRELIEPLLESIGCGEDNTTVLTDSLATKRAVSTALESLARRTSRDDRVYIHFCCHGQQMIDDDGDEPDGLDESLVMYDARRRYSEGIYEGANHLRDDELGRYLDRIRLAAGPGGNVTLVMDACHSGTADRAASDDYIRGTTYIFGPAGQPIPEPEPSGVKHTATLDPGMAPLTVYAACGPDEANHEYRDPATGRYFGSLTYALHRVVTASGTQRRGLSAEGLNRLLKETMDELFAGKRHSQTPFFETTDEGKISIFGIPGGK